MSTFLEQFYDIPVDGNSQYLQRILAADYFKFSSTFKSVKKLSQEYVESLKGSIYTTDLAAHFLYELKDERFIFTLCEFSKDEVYATIEYLEKDLDVCRTNLNLPYKIIYENLEKTNEFTVHYYWLNGKEVIKHYVILKYTRFERIFLRKVQIIEPLNNDTNKPTEIIKSVHYIKQIWLNKNRQKHRNSLPAEVVYTKNLTHVTHKYWYQKDKLHRVNNPAEIVHDLKNRIKKTAFYHLNMKHCLEGPAEMYYNYGEDSGVMKIWYQNDELITIEKCKL